jgi:serine/threonine protein kinase
MQGTGPVQQYTPGSRVGNYEILGALGGEVYRARDVRLSREVALKFLPAALGPDPEHLARLRREARLLASVNRPHIATIHSFE